MEKGPVRRGEIFLAELADRGGRLLKRRPVLVVQNDLGNRFSPETIVAAVRGREGGPFPPVHVPVPKGVAGLEKDSVVDAGHLSTALQGALGPRLGVLPASYLSRVDAALRVSLGLFRF